MHNSSSLSSRITSAVSLHSTIIYSHSPKRPPRDRQTTFGQSLQHLWKANAGSAIFALGDGFKNGGLLLSPFLLLLVGTLAVYCMHLILNSSEMIHDRLGFEGHHGFAKIVQISFLIGPERLQCLAGCMKAMVNFFLSLTQCGFCCVYIVFASDSFDQLCNTYQIAIPVISTKVIVTIPILITCLIRHLKMLTILSTLSNILIFLGIGITLYYTSVDLPSLEERRWGTDVRTLPLFLGTVVYSFESIGLVVPLKNEMINPADFTRPCGVLNIGMTVLIILYDVVGFTSYLKYGDEILGSVSLNIPQDLVLSQIAKIVIALSIMGTFALQMYLPVQILWVGLVKRYGPFKHPILLEELIRILMVAVICTVAIIIPFLNLIISLVGAVSSTFLALIFPAICYMLNAWSDEALTCWIFIKGTFIVLFGLYVFVNGTVESLMGIVIAFQTSNTTYF